METNKIQFLKLFRKWKDGSCTDEERFEFLNKFLDPQNEKLIKEVLDSELEHFQTSGTTDADREFVYGKILDEVKARKDERTKGDAIIYKYRYWWSAAAAVLIVVLVSSVFLTRRNYMENQVAVETTKPTDILPGSNKAFLLLPDNSKVLLDTAQNGIISKQGSSNIVKLDNGILALQNEGSKSAEVKYNTIVTPRGGQYELTLPDGSHIYLNAESSVKFPLEFVETERKIEVTGEVYCDIVKNPEKPFIVSTRDIKIKVLGTQFNVKAYSDEPTINTTLVHGAVKISNSAEEVELIPGQEAILDKSGQILINNNADIEEITAWKDGWFKFNSESIQNIMQQVSRWYDVDVAYEGQITQSTFSGIVSRNSNVSQILRIFSTAGINYRFEGNTIVVMGN